MKCVQELKTGFLKFQKYAVFANDENKTMTFTRTWYSTYFIKRKKVGRQRSRNPSDFHRNPLWSRSSINFARGVWPKWVCSRHTMWLRRQFAYGVAHTAAICQLNMFKFRHRFMGALARKTAARVNSSRSHRQMFGRTNLKWALTTCECPKRKSPFTLTHRGLQFLRTAQLCAVSRSSFCVLARMWLYTIFCVNSNRASRVYTPLCAMRSRRTEHRVRGKNKWKFGVLVITF